jgi:DNA-binding response OmpR family regulator
MSVAMPLLPGRKPNADHRILICEDDRLIAMGWAAMLADGGYTVVGPAHSEEKALKMAYQHLPSLALIDIDLGGTIDGISLAAELAPLGILVIFITGDYKKAAVEGRELAADILIKPVTHSTVLHVVASVLRGKQAANTARAALPAS